ncbi:hypothetical protein ANCCEY_05526 [Ancylostoma ceylanicum]|uniref:Uncharacterized protein n=1 Tax=Ancylostoma ceylanicum TaxID=53326 RepID=A0A0D6M667_9BILA|nr:hypothetical protein ANCCEY_05526 [Ancylostoma ceylanicum]
MAAGAVCIDLLVPVHSIEDNPTEKSTSAEPTVTEAYLVSVNKDRIKEVTKKLKRSYRLIEAQRLSATA